MKKVLYSFNLLRVLFFFRCFGTALGVIFNVHLTFTFAESKELSPVILVNEQIEKKIDSILKTMTVGEKLGQLNQGYKGFATGNTTALYRISESDVAEGKVGAILNLIGAKETNFWQKIAVEQSRLHIPLLFGLDVVHGYRTIFPIPLGMASSWDLAAIEKAAAFAAKEATASGIRWTFSPMVDIARDPRWGRVAEGAGEDPFLGSAIARAQIRGFQGDLKSSNKMAACAKHYVAYGAAEGGREYNTTDISEQTLREIYNPPFEASVKEGVATVMSAFNSLNGIPTSAHPFTLRKVLKTEWNFKGFVVSDWNSIGQLIDHGFAGNQEQAARASFLAGVDMDMVSGSYIDFLYKFLNNEREKILLDEAVRRVLRIKYQLGLFEHPYTDESREFRDIFTNEHFDFARKMAQKSMVLLKNEAFSSQNHPLRNLNAKQTGVSSQVPVLPLQESSSFAVIGPLADSRIDLLGCWYSQGQKEDTISTLQALRNRYPDKEIPYAKGVDVTDPSEEGIIEAINVAKSVETIILVLGERGSMVGEAQSRSSIKIPGRQSKLLEELYKLKKPIILVLINGRPLDLSIESQQVSAILEAWMPGTAGSLAIADILSGDVNPSGKLTISFPRSTGQIPIYYNSQNTGRPFLMDDPTNPYITGYTDLPNSPLFSFGEGMSYTKFNYSQLSIQGDHQFLEVSALIENTGLREGDEIVQLYIHDLVASVARPIKELKGFKKIHLKAKQKTFVQFKLSAKDLSFWHADSQSFVTEPGEFELWIGPHSATGLKGNFLYSDVGGFTTLLKKTNKKY